MEYNNIGLKNILLSMLDEFILICKKYDLKYTLLGGSVLGAIRHGGIIPWDDDIDVGMPRSDYEKLLSIADNVLGTKYKLVSAYNDKDYVYPFAKLFDNETTLVEFKDFFYLGGIYIDIFPLDGIPKNTNLRIKKIWKIRYAATNLILAKFSSEYKKHYFFRYLAYKVIFRGFNNALKICNKIARKYPYSKQYDIANYFGAWREKEISDYSWFNPLIEVTFEGRKVWIPNNYDAYLTKLYGDYMTPPPIEKRKSHHSHYFIDLTRKYTLEEIREMGY